MTELELKSLIEDVLTEANDKVLLVDDLNPADIIIYDQTILAAGNSNIPHNASFVASVAPANVAIVHNEAIVPTAAIVHNEANVTNNLDSSSNEDLSIEDVQYRCVLKIKKQFKLVVINGTWIDEDRKEEYKLLFHPSAPNKTNMTGLQMVKKQLFGKLFDLVYFFYEQFYR